MPVPDLHARVSAEAILEALDELRTLTVLDDGAQSFRARAYGSALAVLREMGEGMAAMTEADLVTLPGVGATIAGKIREYVDSGTIAKLERLRARYPPEYQRLVGMPGVGPKTLARLRCELGVESLDRLQEVLASGEVDALPGLGKGVRAALVRGERFLVSMGRDAWPIARVMPVAERIAADLAQADGVQRVQVSGELRRLLPMVREARLVASAPDPAPVLRRFAALPNARTVETASASATLITHRGLRVRLDVVPADRFSTALFRTTGSTPHLEQLAARATERDLRLDRDGLIDGEGAAIPVAQEADLYERLGLQFVPAPAREGAGEVAAAAAGRLPRPVSLKDIRGDLHLHTDLSGDGVSTIAEVVDAARERGYAYLAVTDHAEAIGRNGASREGLLDQRRRLAREQDRHGDIRLLHGVELNIAADGSLDYDAEFRRGFDWCVASIHTGFEMDRKRQTERIIAAMRDPAVNVIGHVTGRMMGKRPGVELDFERIIDAALATGTAIEINSGLPRLDPDTTLLRQAGQAGVIFAVSTDAHHAREFDRMCWGVQLAQGGWVAPEAIANTWPVERFLAWVRDARAG